MKTVELDTAEARRVKRSEKCQEPEPGSGLFGSIRHVLGTTVAVFQSRIELLTVELKELKGRAVALLFWAAALLFLGFLTFVAIMATVVFAFWEQALPVLAGFSAFFVVLAIASFSFAKAKLSQIPFKETVDQLKKDRHLVVHEKNWDEED
jgi:uncharacterized membrane protein YqjE